MVAQLAIDHHRKQSRTVQTEDDAEFDRLAQRSDDGHEAFLAGATLNPDAISDKVASAEMQRGARTFDERIV